MDERGSVGAVAILVVSILCSCALGALAYVGWTIDYGRRVESARVLRLSLRSAAREVLDELARDATPESDGPRDSVWSRLGPRADGLSLVLADASSRLNPNFVSPELLEKTDLRSLLAPGSSPGSLAAYRAEKGLSADPLHYAGIFADSSLPSLSGFGWANLNIDDRDSLHSLYLSLCGDEDGAEAFSLRLDAARAAKRRIGSGELKSFLGGAYRLAYPTISAEAPYNVNFASPELIRQVLSYPGFGIVDPRARAEAILAARAERDLGPIDISALCGTVTSGPVLDHLGARTWFWTLEAEGRGRRLVLTVAVWPEAESRAQEGKAKRLSIVETRFEP
jgi:hypothetical protein